MSEPRDLAELTGEPDRRYVSPVLANSSQGRQRLWLACILVLALGLPALVVTLGYNRSGEPVAAAMAAPTTTESTIRETTSEKLATTEITEEETTTTVEEPATSTVLETTTVPTYATSAPTTYAAPTTSTTAYAYQAAQAQPEAPTTAAPVTTTTAPYVAPPPAPAQGEAAFLACVRARESGGNYGAVSPGGLYMGAYQFHQATWDNTARMAGRPDLVGVPPNQASPADQDLLAVTLYRAAGAAPWGGYCG